MEISSFTKNYHQLMGEVAMNAALVCLALLTSNDDLRATPPINEVIQGLEDAERLLDSFSVTSRVVSRDVFPGSSRGEKTTHMVATFSVDSSGRSRFRREVVGEGGRLITATLETFDGIEFRSIEGSGDPLDYYSGRISANSSDRTWSVNPWDYTTSFGGNSLSKMLKSHGIDECKSAEWDGCPVVKIVTKPTKTDKRYKGIYLVDIAKGFAVVRKADLIELKGGSNQWLEFHTVESRDLVEIAPAIWVPSKVTSVVSMFDDTSSTMKPMNQSDIENNNWTVNESISGSAFRLDFPGGVSVTDVKQGTTYKTVEITDQVLVDSEAESRTANSTGRSSIGSWTTIGWFALILGAGLLFTSTAALVRRLRRSRRTT